MSDLKSDLQSKQEDTTDNEAVDLLMLFSTQAKSQVQTNLKSITKTQTNILNNSNIIPSPISSNSPLNSNVLPGSSSFQMQRRSSSTTNTNNIRIDQVSRSPGPAAAALATGNSGNSSNKAIVAAAALAAAAATPLPIIRKSNNNSKEIQTNLKLELNDPIDLNQKNKEKNIKDSNNKAFRELNKETKDKIKENSSEKKNIKIEKVNNNNSNTNKSNSNNNKSNINKIKVDTIDTTKKEKTKDKSKEPSKTKTNIDKVNDNKPPSYAVGPDSGIISCICGYDHDDGLTIQCDKCFRWQHLVCMGFKSINDTPDDFQCNLCNKDLHVDVARAKKLQENYLKEEKSKRKRSPYFNENNKNSNKSTGAAQFKKKKVNDSSNESIGINKYNTLYYPIDYFVFQSSAIKSLFNQLPEILKKNKQVMKIDKTNLNKILTSNNQNFNIKSTNENSKMKFTGISKLGLYTTKNIKDNSLITFFSGEINTRENYICEKMNKYWLLGCPKPSVFFHPILPIAIDQRGLGNFTRFIRKSCKPNCEIKTIIINKNEISFGLFSKKEIKADHELTLPWEWDSEHPILNLIDGSKTFESLDNEMRTVLINSIQSILDLTDCGCSNSSPDCIINKVKKSSAYLQRNTRKNNINHLSPTPNQKYTPIQERFKERNIFITKNLISDNNYSKDINDITENKNAAINNNKNSNNSNDNTNNTGTTNNNDSNDATNDLLEESNNSITNHITSDNNNNNLNGDNYSNFNKESNHRNDNKQDFITSNNDSGVNFKFKPKSKNTIYNLHILPKQFELIKKYYQNTEIIQKINDEKKLLEEDNKNEIASMPTPIELSSKILQKLSNSVSVESNSIISKDFNRVNGNMIEIEEKPKVVKKFSLADYKKKKTG